ncbi:MAG: MBL fold metallo-hydrolase [Acidiferrobacterales bacterium]|nr:MBL fold metallo-hydrolase [Acidiferrobacterales bacterium]
MQQYVANSDIFTVDALYHQPQLASIHLIRSNNRIAIVDTGTSHSVAQVNAALDQLGLSFSHVDLIILTHIHLDHAGGASALMALCKNASLVVHPKGARHMVDPSKLIAGTIAVYGEEAFKKLYGEILPIDSERLIIPQDREVVDFSGRSLEFLDTPGHANHHHCIYDIQSNSVFTGDTLGVGYRQLQYDGKVYLSPTTTPVQFNPDALHASIDKVISLNPDWLYLTHYSAVKPTVQNVASLHEQIDNFVLMTEQCSQLSNFESALTQQISNYVAQRCVTELPMIDQEVAQDCLQMDSKLSAQGLVYWWQNRR